MKGPLLAISMLAIGVMPSAQAKEEHIMSCGLEQDTPATFIISREIETDTWAVIDINGNKVVTHTYHASRIGISVKGKLKENMAIDLQFPTSDGMRVVSIQREGYRTSSQIKELKNGVQTNYRECGEYRILFDPDTPGLRSENLTTVD